MLTRVAARLNYGLSRTSLEIPYCTNPQPLNLGWLARLPNVLEVPCGVEGHHRQYDRGSTLYLRSIANHGLWDEMVQMKKEALQNSVPVDWVRMTERMGQVAADRPGQPLRWGD